MAQASSRNQSRGQFTLSDGRAVRLRSLDQWSVYAGLLEGLPTRERNERQIEHVVLKAKEQDRHPPFLIVPIQEPIEVGESHPLGEPTRLPPVGCVGRFRSPKPAHDQAMDCSDLTIVWFQSDYAFPLSPEVERAIITVDWVNLARDSEY
jgi:hypothetical protein